MPCRTEDTCKVEACLDVVLHGSGVWGERLAAAYRQRQPSGTGWAGPQCLDMMQRRAEDVVDPAQAAQDSAD